MIYSLNDPRDGRVRYVGRAPRPSRRFRQHLARPHSQRLRAWIAELRALGLSPVLRPIGDGVEADWIARLRPDLNVLAGRTAPETSPKPEVFAQIRPSPEQLESYRAAAEEDGRSMNKWALRALDRAAAEMKGKKGGKP